jgi:hypothetical protein
MGNLSPVGTPAMPFSTAVVTQLAAHVEHFVERPHPGLLGQPVCPFARRARKGNRVETVVVPFSTADDSAVRRAVEEFEALDKDVLLVVHPEPWGIDFFDLADLQLRFAALLLGRYEVFTGHPEDPFTRAGVLTRQEPYPVLHFIHSDRLIEAERQLAPRRRALAG